MNRTPRAPGSFILASERPVELDAIIVVVGHDAVVQRLQPARGQLQLERAPRAEVVVQAEDALDVVARDRRLGRRHWIRVVERIEQAISAPGLDLGIRDVRAEAVSRDDKAVGDLPGPADCAVKYVIDLAEYDPGIRAQREVRA